MATSEKILDEKSTLEDFKNLQPDEYAREGNKHGKVIGVEIWRHLAEGDND